MADTVPQGLVVWTLDSQRCALQVGMVERVLPALELTPMPAAPAAICGSVVLQGQVVPVLDMRRWLGLPQRELQLGDSLVLARGSEGALAFFADSVQAVVQPEDSQALDALLIDDLSALLHEETRQ